MSRATNRQIGKLRLRGRDLRIRVLNAGDLPYGVRANVEIVQRYGHAKVVEIVRKLGVVGDEVFVPPGQKTTVPLYRTADGAVLCLVPWKGDDGNWMTVLYAEDLGVEPPEGLGRDEMVYEGKIGHQRG